MENKSNYQIIYKPLLPFGFDVEMIETSMPIPDGWVLKEPIQPSWKPVWDGGEWIETATKEEIEESTYKKTPTDLEIIKAENMELKTSQEMLEMAVLELADEILRSKTKGDE